METKYSKEKFDGYTHRFMIQFQIGQPYYSNLTLYSNNDSYAELMKFIEEKKTDKVIDYKIVHRASKEQDEHIAKFLDEFDF